MQEYRQRHTPVRYKLESHTKDVVMYDEFTVKKIKDSSDEHHDAIQTDSKRMAAIEYDTHDVPYGCPLMFFYIIHPPMNFTYTFYSADTVDISQDSTCIFIVYRIQEYVKDTKEEHLEQNYLISNCTAADLKYRGICFIWVVDRWHLAIHGTSNTDYRAIVYYDSLCELKKYHVLCVEYNLGDDSSSIWANGKKITTFTSLAVAEKRQGIVIGNKVNGSCNAAFNGEIATIEVYNKTRVPDLIKETLMKDLCQKYIKE